MKYLWDGIKKYKKNFHTKFKLFKKFELYKKKEEIETTTKKNFVQSKKKPNKIKKNLKLSL